MTQDQLKIVLEIKQLAELRTVLCRDRIREFPEAFLFTVKENKFLDDLLTKEIYQRFEFLGFAEDV